MSRLQRAFWTVNSRTWDDALADPAVVAGIESLARWLADAAPPGCIVLDLGCGTGNHATTVQSLGLHAVGVDSATGMLARASTKRDASGRRLALVRASLAAPLPIAPASVGAAMSIYSAQFLDLAPFFAELRRVLATGGVLLVEVPMPHGPGLVARMPLRHRAFQRVKAVAATLGGWTGAVRWHTADELTAALTRAGFEVVDTRTTPRSTAILARALARG